MINARSTKHFSAKQLLQSKIILHQPFVFWFNISFCRIFLFFIKMSSYGCLKCYKESPHFSNDIKRHHYLFSKEERFQLRTTESYLEAMNQIKLTKKPHRGHRQATSVYLLMFPYYTNFWASLVPDGLHCLDRGVTCSFFEQLFGDHNKHEAFYLGSKHTLDMMDDVISKIKVPIGMKKPPLISKWKSWKGMLNCCLGVTFLHSDLVYFLFRS